MMLCSYFGFTALSPGNLFVVHTSDYNYNVPRRFSDRLEMAKVCFLGLLLFYMYFTNNEELIYKKYIDTFIISSHNECGAISRTLRQSNRHSYFNSALQDSTVSRAGLCFVRQSSPSLYLIPFPEAVY